MTRAEQLHWWRQGYDAGIAAASRERHEQGLYDQSVARFHVQHDADRQAVTGALVLEAVDVLARAMLGDHHSQEGRNAA